MIRALIAYLALGVVTLLIGAMIGLLVADIILDITMPAPRRGGFPTFQGEP